MICGPGRRRAGGNLEKVKAHALDIVCPPRNLDSIVLLSAEVSRFDKMPHHLSPVRLPRMAHDRGRAAEITLTLIFPK